MRTTEDKTGQPVVKKPEAQKDKSSGKGDKGGKPKVRFGDRGTKGTGSAG